MVGCEIPGIKSDAVTVRDHEINMLSVLEFLGGSILGTDLGYIRGDFARCSIVTSSGRRSRNLHARGAFSCSGTMPLPHDPLAAAHAKQEAGPIFPSD